MKSRFFPTSTGLDVESPITPATPDDAYSILVKPIETIYLQVQKAAACRADEANNKAVNIINTCKENVLAALNQTPSLEKTEDTTPTTEDTTPTIYGL